MCVYSHAYVYIHAPTYTYIYTCICIEREMCVCMYVYTYGERERERRWECSEAHRLLAKILILQVGKLGKSHYLILWLAGHCPEPEFKSWVKSEFKLLDFKSWVSYFQVLWPWAGCFLTSPCLSFLICKWGDKRSRLMGLFWVLDKLIHVLGTQEVLHWVEKLSAGNSRVFTMENIPSHLTWDASFWMQPGSCSLHHHSWLGFWRELGGSLFRFPCRRSSVLPRAETPLQSQRTHGGLLSCSLPLW